MADETMRARQNNCGHWVVGDAPGPCAVPGCAMGAADDPHVVYAAEPPVDSLNWHWQAEGEGVSAPLSETYERKRAVAPGSSQFLWGWRLKA